MKLRFKKTPQGKRSEYRYYDANDKCVAVIKPGEEVTEVQIKLLHSLDDAEEYNNCKNCACEKVVDASDTDIQSSRWVVSLDQMLDEDGGNFKENRIVLERAYSRKEQRQDIMRELLYEAVSAYDGTLDPWVPATREFLDTLMPETLSKRAASAMLIAAGLGNEKIVELTGMCIRSVRALRKLMEENEATSAIFAIKPGSGRKKKTAGIEEQIFAELDKGEFRTHKDVIRMLKEKFGIETSINLVSRLMKRWREARGMA